MHRSESIFRTFAFSIFVTIGGLAAVLLGLGAQAALVTLVLVAVEVTFSFDNAIINARILGKLSGLWQKLFLTVGVVIAILGMRIVFPILIVALTAHLGWREVTDLALHHPAMYADKLRAAHVSIAAFGGAFLLLLALQFFFDDTREVLWLERLEWRMQRLSKIWMPACVTGTAIVAIALLPADHQKRETLLMGLIGIAVYGAMQLVNIGIGRLQKTQTHGDGMQHGMAALVTFIYLEVLDASFSFDGVIGAFAVTDKVVLIAVGLGIGALWVRSLTVYMVHQHTLSSYRYLEHGAHYAILVLAGMLLASVVANVPDIAAGIAGLVLIGASLRASMKALIQPKS